MPREFRKKYPSTRVIIDATELFVEQPQLPELQKMKFQTLRITTLSKH